MHPKQFALVSGIVFLLLGVLAFVPSLSTVPLEGLPLLKVSTSYGLVFNLIPMNIVNKIALIAFGLAGIAAYNARFTNLPASIRYCRWVFVVMGVLAIMGMFVQTDTLFGIMPLYGNGAWEHGAFSLLGGYFGYTLTAVAHKLSSESQDRPLKPGLR